MARRRIIIPTDRDGEPVGAQLKTILDRQIHYSVAVAEINRPIDILDELVIPVLPVSLENAARLMTELQAQDTRVPILPVVRSENLNRIENLCPWVRDFLVSPLRDQEVWARVKRLLNEAEQSHLVHADQLKLFNWSVKIRPSSR